MLLDFADGYNTVLRIALYEYILCDDPNFRVYCSIETQYHLHTKFPHVLANPPAPPSTNVIFIKLALRIILLFIFRHFLNSSFIREVYVSTGST